MKKILVALTLVAAAGCVPPRYIVPRAKIPDAPRPPPKFTAVDFGPVFDVRVTSHSVAAVTERANLKRVMLSPNLLFESSRSSAREPDVSGPRSENPATPNLSNALGKPVETWLSSVLMNDLVRRGAGMVATAVSRFYADECNTKCDAGTWVERVLARYRQAASNPRGAEEIAELPTALLAVRELGLSWRPVDVVATRAPGGELTFTPRRRPGEGSACPAARIELPEVRFAAELLSLRDGRILARIDETITPSFRQGFKRSVEAERYRPVKETGYTREDAATKAGLPPTYPYVARWEAEDAACANALEEYAALREAALKEIDLPALAREVIQLGLSRVAPVPEPRGEPARAAEPPQGAPSP